MRVISPSVSSMFLVGLLFTLEAFALLPRPVPRLKQEAFIGAGFKTKLVCSGVFVSGRDPRRVEQEDFQGESLSLKLMQTRVDYKTKCVTTSLLPIAFTQRTACYNEEFGCRLTDVGTPVPLPNNALNGLVRNDSLETPVFIPRNPALEAIVERAFTYPRLNTRALMIIHKDKVLAERYADGFNLNTRMHGWSMSKSITNAMLAVLIKEGKIALEDRILFPSWNQSPYNLISLQNLLEMSSGLKFLEDYGNPLSDVNQMLFAEADMGAFAAQQSPEALAGEKWQYSSGTSNILQSFMKRSFPTLRDYLRFPYEKFFSRAGMKSVVFEVDASGTFVGSSHVYATTRDWARFGQLLLHDGKTDQDQILPNNWVHQSSQAAPKSPNGKYGKHFWTNHGSTYAGNDRPWPSLPTDAFAAIGYNGQNVLVIPSRSLVIVRFGHTKPESLWDMNGFAGAVLETLPR